MLPTLLGTLRERIGPGTGMSFEGLAQQMGVNKSTPGRIFKNPDRDDLTAPDCGWDAFVDHCAEYLGLSPLDIWTEALDKWSEREAARRSDAARRRARRS